MVNGDARDEELIKKHIKGKDYIFPLAALVGFPLCLKDPIAATTTNLEAVKLILRLREPHQRVIFPCTNSGYGLGQGQQFCTEDSPIEPISLYGKTKMEAEAAVLSAGNSLTFRFATLFGASPRMRTDLLVNDFTYRAVQQRDTQWNRATDKCKKHTHFSSPPFLEWRSLTVYCTKNSQPTRHRITTPEIISA